MKQQENNAPLNAKGLTSPIAPTVKDETGSTTKSGVAAGTITVTNKGNQKQDIKDLNRDTRNSLNKLGEIFDKAKVEERQELIGILSREGNEAIYKISDYYGWEEGSTEKALAHGVLGAITGELSGGSLTGSAIAGGMSEYVTGYIEKKMGTEWMLSHPDVVQAISTAVGGTIGDITGAGSVSAYIAQNAAKWNYFGFAIPQTEMLKNTLVKEDGSKLTDKEAEQLGVRILLIADDSDSDKAYSDTLEMGDTADFEIIREKLISEGFTGESVDRYLYQYSDMIQQLQTRPKIPEGLKEVAISTGKNTAAEAADAWMKKPIGTATVLGWSLYDDGDIEKYGIQGVRKRIILDMGSTAVIAYSLRKGDRTTKILAGTISDSYLEYLKDDVAPDLSNDSEKRKQQDEEYLQKILDNDPGVD